MVRIDPNNNKNNKNTGNDKEKQNTPYYWEGHFITGVNTDVTALGSKAPLGRAPPPTAEHQGTGRERRHRRSSTSGSITITLGGVTLGGDERETELQQAHGGAPLPSLDAGSTAGTQSHPGPTYVSAQASSNRQLRRLNLKKDEDYEITFTCKGLLLARKLEGSEETRQTCIGFARAYILALDARGNPKKPKPKPKAQTPPSIPSVPLIAGRGPGQGEVDHPEIVFGPSLGPLAPQVPWNVPGHETHGVTRPVFGVAERVFVRNPLHQNIVYAGWQPASTLNDVGLFYRYFWTDVITNRIPEITSTLYENSKSCAKNLWAIKAEAIDLGKEVIANTPYVTSLLWEKIRTRILPNPDTLFEYVDSYLAERRILREEVRAKAQDLRLVDYENERQLQEMEEQDEIAGDMSHGAVDSTLSSPTTPSLLRRTWDRFPEAPPVATMEFTRTMGPDGKWETRKVVRRDGQETVYINGKLVSETNLPSSSSSSSPAKAAAVESSGPRVPGQPRHPTRIPNTQSPSIEITDRAVADLSWHKVFEQIHELPLHAEIHQMKIPKDPLDIGRVLKSRLNHLRTRHQGTDDPKLIMSKTPAWYVRRAGPERVLENYYNEKHLFNPLHFPERVRPNLRFPDGPVPGLPLFDEALPPWIADEVSSYLSDPRTILDIGILREKPRAWGDAAAREREAKEQERQSLQTGDIPRSSSSTSSASGSKPPLSGIGRRMGGPEGQRGHSKDDNDNDSDE